MYKKFKILLNNFKNYYKIMSYKCNKRKCIKITRVLKKVYVYIRSTLKLVSLVALGLDLIGAILVLVYKPIYKVTLDGEKIGYCENKNALQDKIN